MAPIRKGMTMSPMFEDRDFGVTMQRRQLEEPERLRRRKPRMRLRAKKVLATGIHHRRHRHFTW